MFKIQIEKIQELEDAIVPNNIPVNNVYTGVFVQHPIEGYSFVLKREKGNFITSIVTKIIDLNTFQTLNSVYKLTMLE